MKSRSVKAPGDKTLYYYLEEVLGRALEVVRTENKTWSGRFQQHR